MALHWGLSVCLALRLHDWAVKQTVVLERVKQMQWFWMGLMAVGVTALQGYFLQRYTQQLDDESGIAPKIYPWFTVAVMAIVVSSVVFALGNGV